MPKDCCVPRGGGPIEKTTPVIRILSLFALLAGAGYFYLINPEESNPPPTNANNLNVPGQPDIYGRSVEYHQLNPDGTLHYRLNAERLEQYSERAYAEMEAPVIHLTSPSQPPWDIRSDLGTIRNQSETANVKEDMVYLNENVYLVQKHPENGVMTVRTDVFRLYPDRQYAETDQDVIIDTEVGRTVAAGLMADLETGVLKLSSDSKQRVHTIVLPEQFKKS